MITNTDHKAGLKITFPASGRIRAEVPVILQDRRGIRGRSLWTLQLVTLKNGHDF